MSLKCMIFKLRFEDLVLFFFKFKLISRPFDINADVDLFGVRELLAIENEKQSNGKILKKVII
jgi:hypothetical protein